MSVKIQVGTDTYPRLFDCLFEMSKENNLTVSAQIEEILRRAVAQWKRDRLVRGGTRVVDGAFLHLFFDHKLTRDIETWAEFYCRTPENQIQWWLKNEVRDWMDAHKEEISNAGK